MVHSLKEFLLDMSEAGGQVHFKAMRKLASEHPSEQVGAEIRKSFTAGTTNQTSLLTTNNYKQNITPPYCIGKEGYFIVIGNLMAYYCLFSNSSLFAS